ncbi:MAG: hypothetical protein ACD_16C00189G0004 [uncultured bacterium]|nr:MAG: hypothetical protein ACD_16C00189G0004 [uncultured bacterium]OFW69207.1 MAG: hypothetical protein A2X70_02960 [Alphaproteobacteria bacterium GWC2_42_16]OFW73893.1 MAG: hypothetical protein A2Z80_03530 [Alphaproteobacteria bacterium GWA2_41_27]OFW82747.1 MAG: hypothetical protein A3E50_01215 [Alphaproteobacteria bacterium RIFCSPHIGHO2_12_FULL_42_100]OFW86514.1 MAG: hypothetical protein A2W06_07290 [Alphaproteobacteria bacterium RBG_16_42_14]OFW91901.1 MAG: hypothetical protein A3C41_039
MKLKMLSAVFFLLAGVSAHAVQGGYAQYVDSEKQVSDLVVKCLGLTGIVIKGEKADKSWPEQRYTLSSRKLEDVIEVVQGKADPKVSWKKDGERWNMSNLLLSVSTAKKILELGQEGFGFKNPTLPKEENYEGILVLGATAGRFYDRVLFTNDLVNKGIKFEKVYILAGQRPLEAFEKKEFPCLKETNDEGQMTEEIFQRNAIPGLQEKKVLVYSKPPEGSPRATTESTIHTFMTLNPSPGKYLCVSNGYFVPYQELVIQNALDKQYPKAGLIAECVGPANQAMKDDATDEEVVKKAAVFLDNLSRILYNLKVRASLQK